MTTSAKMKAVRLFEHGSPDVLQYVEVDMPEVGAHDVLIKVHATSINMWDLRYRQGKLPRTPIPGRPPFPLPFQLGRDAAGEVVAVGSNVTRWKVGDRVLQMPNPVCGQCTMCTRGKDNLCINTSFPGHQIFGGYAQYVARPENAVLRIPDHIDYSLAAATMWTYVTPLACAMNRAPVRPGDTLLITGASGGMASACLQIAKLFGARVIGSTTKMDRTEELLALGYDHIVDYKDPATPGRVKELTKGIGADAVWDLVGGTDSLRFSIHCAGLGANVALLGVPISEDSAELALNAFAFILGEVSVIGVRGGGRRMQEMCVDLLGEGKIKPVIDRSFPLSQAADAHRYLESGQQIGKIVLVPEHD